MHDEEHIYACVSALSAASFPDDAGPETGRPVPATPFHRAGLTLQNASVFNLWHPYGQIPRDNHLQKNYNEKPLSCPYFLKPAAPALYLCLLCALHWFTAFQRLGEGC